eukprot:717573-Rhodomonas_salina.1
MRRAHSQQRGKQRGKEGRREGGKEGRREWGVWEARSVLMSCTRCACAEAGRHVRVCGAYGGGVDVSGRGEQAKWWTFTNKDRA